MPDFFFPHRVSSVEFRLFSSRRIFEASGGVGHINAPEECLPSEPLLEFIAEAVLKWTERF